MNGHHFSISVTVERRLRFLSRKAGGILQAAVSRFRTQGVPAMAWTIEAIYENGVLKPTQPLPLREREQVRLTIQQVESPLLRAYGIMGWTGTHEELEQILAEAEAFEDLP
jgi:predicted DNA-binding antitoxin AbrB/MazE fold protein